MLSELDSGAERRPRCTAARRTASTSMPRPSSRQAKATRFPRRSTSTCTRPTAGFPAVSRSASGSIPCATLFRTTWSRASRSAARTCGSRRTSPPRRSNSTRRVTLWAASRTARWRVPETLPAGTSLRWLTASRTRRSCSWPASSRAVRLRCRVSSEAPSSSSADGPARSFPPARDWTRPWRMPATRRRRASAPSSSRTAESRTQASDNPSRRPSISPISTRTVVNPSSPPLPPLGGRSSTGRSSAVSRVSMVSRWPSTSSAQPRGTGRCAPRCGARASSTVCAASAIAGCFTTRAAPLSVCARRSSLATSSPSWRPRSRSSTSRLSPSRSSRASIRKYL